MADQSDWVKLAERLGAPGSGVFIHIGNDAFHVKTLAAQDLLIGLALRVAWEKGSQGQSVVITDWLWSKAVGNVANRSGDDTYRATAALELLDAVGYEHA
jgi:hypothetical protein